MLDTILSTILLLFSLLTGDFKDGFKNEQRFESYIKNLSLSELNSKEAIARLKALEFKCYPEKDTVSCYRETSGLICMQTQVVKLITINQQPLKVTNFLQHTCV